MNHQTKIVYRQSKQRNRILELLNSIETHPTAGWVYEQLKNEFPKLSLGTVYRNLSILEEQQLVKKIHYGSAFDRFEAKTTPHYHLICEKCGKIEDFELSIYNEINRKAKKKTDFNIHHHKLEFFGLCKDCSK
jgi:Fur family peroxide stress response transcriptional regulator